MNQHKICKQDVEKVLSILRDCGASHRLIVWKSVKGCLKPSFTFAIEAMKKEKIIEEFADTLFLFGTVPAHLRKKKAIKYVDHLSEKGISRNPVKNWQSVIGGQK